MDVQAYIQSGAIENYVLGLATPEEAEELLRYRVQYPEVEAAVAAFESALEAHSRANAVPVGEDGWQGVAARLQGMRPAAAPATGRQWQRPLVLRIWKAALAAAVILLCVSVALNVLLFKRYHRMRSDYAALQRDNGILFANSRLNNDTIRALYTQVRTLASPGIQKITLSGVPGKEEHLVTVYWNAGSREVYVFPNRLPAVPPGKQFQLWAMVDGKPVDAGVLGACEALCRLKPVERADAFAVTLEKEGGSPVPDLTQLYVMGKVAG